MKNCRHNMGIALTTLLLSGALLLAACESVDEEEFEQMEQEFQEQQS
jgi:hypothetical protein